MNKRFAIAGIIAFAFLLLNVSLSHADIISVTLAYAIGTIRR